MTNERNIKTPSDLKRHRERTIPESHFFERKTMKWFGDTMRNFGLKQPRKVIDIMGDEREVYELYRKMGVKHGLSTSSWFDATTLERVHLPVRYSPSTWVMETGHGVQKYIRMDLYRNLSNAMKGSELDQAIEDAMHGRLCDLENKIDISQWVNR